MGRYEDCHPNSNEGRQVEKDDDDRGLEERKFDCRFHFTTFPTFSQYLSTQNEEGNDEKCLSKKKKKNCYSFFPLLLLLFFLQTIYSYRYSLLKKKKNVFNYIYVVSSLSPQLYLNLSGIGSFSWHPLHRLKPPFFLYCVFFIYLRTLSKYILYYI